MASRDKDARRREDGAQGRNRTTDTVIFSHVLYQLSYLGDRPREAAGKQSAGRYRGWISACPEPAKSPPRPAPAAKNQASAPIAARNRCFSATPSRRGSTRGGSSGSIATRANSGPFEALQPPGEIGEAGLVGDVEAGGDAAGARHADEVGAVRVWLACPPVSP